MTNEKQLARFFNYLVKNLFSQQALSVEARMRTIIETQVYLLERILRIFFYDTQRPQMNSNLTCNNNYKYSPAKISFIFDPQGKRIIDMFYVSSKELNNIKKITVPIVENSWEVMLNLIKKEKNIKVEQAVLRLAKGVLLSRLNQKLKIPALLLAIYTLIETAKIALKEEIMINLANFSIPKTTVLENDETNVEIPDIT